MSHRRFFFRGSGTHFPANRGEGQPRSGRSFPERNGWYILTFQEELPWLVTRHEMEFGLIRDWGISPRSGLNCPIVEQKPRPGNEGRVNTNAAAADGSWGEGKRTRVSIGLSVPLTRHALAGGANTTSVRLPAFCVVGASREPLLFRWHSFVFCKSKGPWTSPEILKLT